MRNILYYSVRYCKRIISIMEHNPSPFGAETPGAETGPDGNGKKKSKRETASGQSKKSPESQPKSNKREAAKKIADASIFDKLSEEFSAGKQSEKKTGHVTSEKPESEKPRAKVTKEKSPAAAPEKPSRIGTKEKSPDDSQVYSGEIPLDDDTRTATEGYIRLREEDVEAEIDDVGEDQPDANEAAADAALLHNASEEIAGASDGSSTLEVIDEAYQETLDELPKLSPLPEQVPPSPFPAAAAEAPSPALMERMYREQQGVPSTSQVLAESFTSDEPSSASAAPEANFYNSYNSLSRDAGALVKTAAETRPKITERKPSVPAPSSIEMPAPLRPESPTAAKQIQTIERHIDRREADIRDAAKEQYFAQPQYSGAMRPEARRSTTASPELPEPTNLKKPEKTDAERVSRMSHRDLLKASEKVIVDGVSLRTIYEAKQITESGLQRVMHEYYRGGDLKKTLDRELLAKEMSYERDPQVRDRLTQSYASVQSAAQQSKPVSPIFEANKPTGPAAPPTPQPAPSAPRRQASASISAEQLVSYIWGGIIVILAITAFLIWLLK